jgi:hypothetical protein
VWAYRGIDLFSYRDIAKGRVGMSRSSSLPVSGASRLSPFRPFAVSLPPPRPLHSLPFTTHYTLYGSRFSGHQTRRAEEPFRRTSEVSLTTRS